MSSQHSPDLSFVIPVFNAAETLEGLLACLKSITGFQTEIILVDDASTDGSRDIIRTAAREQDNIVALFNDVNAGAGQARNIGFAACSGRYALFLDADDILHEQVIRAPLGIMDRDDTMDVAIFQYHYTDDAERSYKGMSYVDEKIFGKVLAGSASRTTSILKSPELTRITNYPWNKIIRSDRYRQQKGIFGSTKVHNDILAHWHVLLNSRKILVLQDRICTHVVPENGSNITNISSGTRLELFEALGQTYGLLREHPALKRPCIVHFWDLAVSLATWARTRMERDAETAFHDAYKRLIEGMDLEDLLILRKHGHHAVADRIVDEFSCKAG